MDRPLIAIIFDWHGVLDCTTYRGFSRFLSSLIGRPPEEIRSVVAPMEAQYVVGRLAPDAFWSFLERELTLTPEQLQDVREHLLIVRKNELLWVMLPELAQRYVLAVLSDCPADKLTVIRSTTDLALFRTAHFSCEQGRGKDDDAFFCTIVRELGIPPSACLFVDDTDKHIMTAKRLGFQTHSFTSLEDLARALAGATAPAET